MFYDNKCSLSLSYVFGILRNIFRLAILISLYANRMDLTQEILWTAQGAIQMHLEVDCAFEVANSE